MLTSCLREVGDGESSTGSPWFAARWPEGNALCDLDHRQKRAGEIVLNFFAEAQMLANVVQGQDGEGGLHHARQF
jgi:hypothetical protein